MDTPLLPTEARFMLAGGAMGKPEDVVEAGTRPYGGHSEYW